MANERWIITGGTGLVGKALSRDLVSAGHRVTILSRSSGEKKDGVEQVAWTPTKAGAWQEALDGADVVVHLAGANVAEGRWTESRLAEIRESRITSGKLIAEALAAAKKKPKIYVSASAIGYYGLHESGPTFDETSAAGQGTLASICVDWEASANAARDAGIPVTHPRIGVVLAKNGGALEKMVPPFKAFVGGPIGSGKQWLSWVHLTDVVGSIRFAVDHALAGPFNVVAPEPKTMDEFAGTLGRTLGRPSAVRAPAFAIKIAFGEMGDVVLKGQRVIPAKLEREGYAFRFPTLSGALENILG